MSCGHQGPPPAASGNLEVAVGGPAWLGCGGKEVGGGELEAALGTAQDMVALQVKGATLWSDSKQLLNFNVSKTKNPLSYEGLLLSK